MPSYLPPATAFLTEIPDRKPKFKIHTSLSLAKSAVGWPVGREQNARGGKVYEIKDNEWSLVYDVAKGTKPEDLPWKRK